MLEGIYPSLSHGVGIPLERRARNFTLPATAAARNKGRVQEIEENKDVELLGEVAAGLIGVMEGGEKVGRTVRERCLVDVLAGCGELAFMEGGESAEQWKERWRKLIDRYDSLMLPLALLRIQNMYLQNNPKTMFTTPLSVSGDLHYIIIYHSDKTNPAPLSTPTSALLPPLISLLHPLTPTPFRQPLAYTLSTLPLRPNAIRPILQLFLSTVADSALSVDALTNASRIICAAPKSTTPEGYFSTVCPQLLECLDGEDAVLARAAGFVIAELLGKKGRVEVEVEREIVGVIVKGLDPTWGKREEVASKLVQGDKTKTSSALLELEDSPPTTSPPRSSLIQEITVHKPTPITETPDNPQETSLSLVSEQTLSTTLTRLSTLLASHPSPSVPQRLLSPLLLPLWALISYASETSRSTWHTRASTLLKSYLKTSTTTSTEDIPLTRLQRNLLFTGNLWEFGPGSSGGIEIRPRGNQSVLGLDVIEARVDAFLALLTDVPESTLNAFFLELLRGWLGQQNTDVEGEDGPMGVFATLKVLQGVLDRHSDTLAKAPGETLQIVGGVMAEYVEWREGLKQQEEQVGMPSLGGLGRIVKDGSVPSGRFMGEDGEEQDEETERDETIMVALSLLSVLISQPGTKLTEADERLITTLHPPLRYLSSSPGIDPDLSSLAVNIASLLSLHEPAAAPATSSLAEQQKESYVLALSYLRDPLVPVRAHGLHLLRELILARAAVVDVVGTMRLLLGMLKGGESYVYLNVVKCLAALTERHGKMVTRMLVESYVDDVDVLSGEEGKEVGRLGLDERLRIGEALLVTVQRLGGALVGETAEVVGESMIGIVSRRRVKRGEGGGGEEWGSDPEDDEDDDTKERRKAERTYKARIVKGWEPKNDTEDMRIRTSALSILGAAVETNAPGLGPRILTEALSTSLSILTLETKAERAILRRAAVVCIGSVLKSLVGMNGDEKEDHGAWRTAVWDVVKNRAGEIRRVLGYVRVSDNDGLVREQAGVVGENLEAVVERWMLGGSSGGVGRIVEIGEGGLGDLKIL